MYIENELIVGHSQQLSSNEKDNKIQNSCENQLHDMETLSKRPETSSSTHNDMIQESNPCQLKIANLSKYVSSKDISKLCASLNISDNVKIKKAPKWDFAILTFEVSISIFFNYLFSCSKIYYSIIVIIDYLLLFSKLFGFISKIFVS